MSVIIRKPKITTPLSDQLTSHRLELARNGYTVISNYLPSDFAEMVHEYLLRMPDNFWYLSTFPSPHGAVQSFLPVIPETDEERQVCWDLAGKKINEPRYLGYRFYRTNDPQAGCDCPACLMRKVFEKDVLQDVRKISALPLTQIYAAFLSKYSAGCFLNCHGDKGRGDIAFVYNLTKDWHVMQGGVLTMLENDEVRVKKTIIPEFNSLTLFTIPEGGVPHCVTAVPETVEKSRYAFSGWYRQDFAG